MSRKNDLHTPIEEQIRHCRDQLRHAEHHCDEDWVARNRKRIQDQIDELAARLHSFEEAVLAAPGRRIVLEEKLGMLEQKAEMLRTQPKLNELNKIRRRLAKELGVPENKVKETLERLLAEKGEQDGSDSVTD